MGLRTSLYDHRYLTGTCLAYMFIALGVAAFYHDSVSRLCSLVLVMFMPLLVYFIAISAICFVQSMLKPRMAFSVSFSYFHSLIDGFDRDWEDYMKSSRFYDGVVGLLSISMLISFFCLIKSMFPVMAFVQLDSFFAEADRIIHGAYPHTYLMPYIAGTETYKGFEGLYVVWFGVMSVANLYSLFYDRNYGRRKQYLWSFVLSWILLGTITALLFYSVGPVFFHQTYPDLDNPYRDLLHWLATANGGEPTFSYKGAMFLYEAAMDNDHPDLNGPSAMPSMHIAISWLITLYGFRLNRLIGWGMLFYTIALLVSSIGLGWHYAVDGYAGILGMSGIWFMTGYLLKRHKMVKADT